MARITIAKRAKAGKKDLCPGFLKLYYPGGVCEKSFVLSAYLFTYCFYGLFGRVQEIVRFFRRISRFFNGNNCTSFD